jgi:hypothetical protein
MTTGLARACLLIGCAFVLCTVLNGCSKPVANSEKESPKQTATASPATELSKHIWRVEQPASAFVGTIYIFVPDGTLLETSCKETYRIAKWSADPSSPGAIQVVEDGSLPLLELSLMRGLPGCVCSGGSGMGRPTNSNSARSLASSYAPICAEHRLASGNEILKREHAARILC